MTPKVVGYWETRRRLRPEAYTQETIHRWSSTRRGRLWLRVRYGFRYRPLGRR